MRFTIVIPMKNMADYVGQTLDSILSQDYEDLEVLAIDDGSTDGSMDVVRRRNDPRVQAIANPGKGWPDAFNHGVAIATGDYVSKCDADDLYPTGRVATQAKYLADHPEYDAVSGYMAFITSDGRDVVTLDEYPPEPIDFTERMRGGEVPGHNCAIAFRTEVMRQTGGARGFFRTCGDIDMCARFADHGRVLYCPYLAYVARLHDSSLTRSRPVSELAWFGEQVERFCKQRAETETDDLMRNDPPVEPKHEGPGIKRSAATAARELIFGRAWAAIRQSDATTARLYARRLLPYVVQNPASAGEWLRLAKSAWLNNGRSAKAGATA
ncbi:MAG: glycosyltransferase [Planctomycetota bacterium]